MERATGANHRSNMGVPWVGKLQKHGLQYFSQGGALARKAWEKQQEWSNLAVTYSQPRLMVNLMMSAHGMAGGMGKKEGSPLEVVVEYVKEQNIGRNYRDTGQEWIWSADEFVAKHLQNVDRRGASQL